MWPNEKGNCERYKDFYCLDPYKDPSDPNYPCCWLNPLMDGANGEEERIAKAMLYFQQMSEAFAMTCWGDVYILSENPSTINQQVPGERPSIWLSHELPQLQRLYREQIVTKLIAVTGHPGAWTGGQVDVTHLLGEQIPDSPSKRDAEDTTEFTKSVARALMEQRKKLLDAGIRPRNISETLDRLNKRACTSSSDSENPRGDYFG
jgi:hypothetical protein